MHKVDFIQDLMIRSQKMFEDEDLQELYNEETQRNYLKTGQEFLKAQFQYNGMYHE